MNTMDADWINQATWIWLPNYDAQALETPAVFVLFRKTFNVDEVNPTEKCIVHVSADTRYRLFINGVSVSFGPCKSYLGRWYYETVDIAPHLVQGTNILAAKVLRYSSNEPGPFSWVRANRPGLMIHGKFGFNSKTQNLSTDGSWKCAVDESVKLVPTSKWNYILGPPLFSVNEQVKTGLAEPDWFFPTFEDKHWSPAESKSKPKMLPVNDPWRLHERPIPMLPEISSRFESVTKCDLNIEREKWNALFSFDQHVTIPANSETWVDLQSANLTTGFLDLCFSGGTGTTITIRCAECYENGLGVRTSPFPIPRQKGDRTDHARGVLYGTTDFLKIGPSEPPITSYSPFWFRTFRYIRLTITTGPSDPISITRFQYRATHYPLPLQTTIATLPPALSPIFQTSVTTLQNCMHETYEDCPFYEQNQFLADSRLAMLFTYQLSRDDRLARKTIHEFYASRGEDGLLEAQFPHPLGTGSMNLPTFSLYWVWMLFDHHLYFRDAKFVTRYLGAVDDVLGFFASTLNHDGLVGQLPSDTWAFVDWVPEWEKDRKQFTDMAVPDSYVNGGVATFNSLLYAWTLYAASKLADVAGRNDTAREYKVRAHTLTTAVNKHCFRDGWYRDGSGEGDGVSQHCQVFAILSGAIAGEEARALFLRMLEEPGLPKCSYALQFYVFEAAARVGVLASVLPQLMRPYEDMLRMGLTTWAEKDANPRSDCHAWSSSPIYLIVRRAFGVAPVVDEKDAAVFDVMIEPDVKMFGGSAQGDFVTSKGRVGIAWSEESGLTLWARDEDVTVCLKLEGARRIEQLRAGGKLDVTYRDGKFLW